MVEQLTCAMGHEWCRGVNGAGKTTTLSILSGDLKPTRGDAFINGHSVSSDLASAQKQMGYCPQFNPLLDFMTAREHLHMYASLKGVPSQNVKEVVNDLVEAVGLHNYVDCVAGSYSGGNKRKLALAIALVSANFSSPCWLDLVSGKKKLTHPEIICEFPGSQHTKFAFDRISLSNSTWPFGREFVVCI